MNAVLSPETPEDAARRFAAGALRDGYKPKPLHRYAAADGSPLYWRIRMKHPDGRKWIRPMHDSGNGFELGDLIALHTAVLGGADVVSAAESSIVRRAAVLTVELERMEQDFARAGQADAKALLEYQTAVNTLRRLLESIGMQRRPRDVTPKLSDYLHERAEASA